MHEVERQLSDLQLSLHVNVGPRKQALEHLRGKIEEQNHAIDGHRAAFRKAKAAMEEAATALAAAEKEKAELSQQLTMLVTQSAGAQMQACAWLGVVWLDCACCVHRCSASCYCALPCPPPRLL